MLSKGSKRELASAALQRVTALSQCTRETLDSFVTEGILRVFKRGEAVCRKGGTVENLCVIVTGSVEVSTTSVAGKRHVLHFLESGQIFGLIAVMDEGPGIHDAIAHSETLALLIPRATLLAAMDREPHLAVAVIRLLCLRSRVLYDYVSEHTLLPLRARCARLLLSLVEPYGVARPEGHVITLKLSQDEFADMLGRSRQSVNKELRALETEGVIRTNYSEYIIVDLAMLRTIAGRGD